MAKTLARGEAKEKDIWLYSLGNIANNLIFLFVGTYVMYFFTNLLKISPFQAGLILMVARLVDAVTDPLMGMIVDRTNTKHWGKYRPFIVFGAPFLGIIFVLLFTCPQFGPVMNLVYAYVIYIMYSLAWTVVQIPQLALPIMLSNDVARRTRIQSIFQALGTIASLAVTSFALPLLNHFGGQDDPHAWTVVVIGIAVVATILFILSAQSVRKLDVYNPAQAEKKDSGAKMSFAQSMAAVFKNRALVCVLIAYGTDMFAMQISNAARLYFFTYNLGGRTDLISYIGYVGTIVSFLMIFFVQPLVAKTGKKWSIIVVEALAILLTLPMMFMGKSVTAVMFTLLTIAFTQNLNNMLSRAAVLDAANYSEWKTGMNNSALVSSTFTFINKCCQAFSAFFMGSIMTAVGYDEALAVQSEGTQTAFLLMMTLIPIIGYVCSLVGMWFYPMSRKDEIEMQEALRAKRAAERQDEPQIDF
ncbi:glycoside-pentoside-hexuronide (GPH):cation symporter [Fournierella sp.]|uniref:MFS transporter n=1 Tax=Allofournierella sp. TaxID=1940256 RepID=UPI0025C01FBA|nr:glycoside-pentoside-hexuronide (GPH):cation symporter [Fournierella sp.]